MAFLKRKEYARAVQDATCALVIMPEHSKSWLRRAAGLNAIGKHRAALVDLSKACEIDPSCKQAHSEIFHTRELLRSAATRAPFVNLDIFSGSYGYVDPVEGPDIFHWITSQTILVLIYI